MSAVRGRPVSTRATLVAVLVGLLALVVVGAPRFARGLGEPPQLAPLYVSSSGERVEGLVTDQVEYLRLVDWASGRRPAPDTAPFTQRLLVPALAAFVPLDEPIALNVVNLALMGVGLVSLVLLIRSWVGRSNVVVLVALLYGTGFPVLWYATSSWVDAGAVGLAGLVVYAAYRRWWLAVILLVPAVLAKESAMVCVAFGLALEWTRDPAAAPRAPRAVRLVAWPAAGVLGMLAARLLAPPSSVTAPWRPSDLDAVQHWLASNFNGPRNLAHVLLTGALPLLGLLFTWFGVRGRRMTVPRERLLPLTAGCLAVLALSAGAVFGALWDGRTVWMLVPLGLPLLAMWLDQVGLAGFGQDRVDEAASTSVGRVQAATTPWVQLGCVIVAAVLTLPLVASELASASPGAVSASSCRFADRLAELDEFEGSVDEREGDATIDLPADLGDAPLVVELSSDQAVTLQVLDAGGAVLDEPVSADERYHGTVLIDAGPDASVLGVESSGSWSLVQRPVSQLFNWEAVGPLRGDGDAVLVIPGGSRVAAIATLRSSDPDAGIVAVGATPSAGVEPEPVVELPRGTEAVQIRGSEWQLSTDPDPLPAPSGC